MDCSFNSTFLPSQLLFFSCVVLHVPVAVRATSGRVLQNSSFVNGKTTRPVCVVHVDNERRRRPFQRGSSTVARNRSFRNVVRRRRSYCSMVERGKFSLVAHSDEIREEQASLSCAIMRYFWVINDHNDFN